MNYCTITPDRGDRPELTAFMRKQLSRCQAGEPSWPEKALIINNPSDGKAIDIIPRVQYGIKMAREIGYEWAIIIENDDYYPKFYLSDIAKYATDDIDFIGWQNTTYYNIKERTYQRMEHETHSSLFTTAFRISALDDFQWPADNYAFLDLALWRHAKRGNRWKLLRTENPCLGIKGHGMGKMGGKGHVMKLNKRDDDLSFLRSRVDDEAFAFYTDLMKRI